MVFKKRKVVSALLKKGFKENETVAHVGFTYITLDGVKSRIRTYVSHGRNSEDLSDHLIGQMARQVKLKKKKFEELISCPMKQPEYEKIIKDEL